MKRKIAERPPLSAGERIKLRINSRTIIIVRTMDAVKMWLTKYPGAQIIP